MSMVRMVAERDFSYSTRRLKAGDVFETSARDAKILSAIRKARIQREPGEIAAPPAALKARLAQLDHDGDGQPGGSKRAAGDLAALREEYLRVVGKRPFNGWDADALREKIAAASA